MPDCSMDSKLIAIRARGHPLEANHVHHDGNTTLRTEVAVGSAFSLESVRAVCGNPRKTGRFIWHGICG